jgi:hypothetical protein
MLFMLKKTALSPFIACQEHNTHPQNSSKRLFCELSDHGKTLAL